MSHMGHQIIKQPDGQYAVWSSVVDNFVFVNATPADIVDYFIDEYRISTIAQVGKVVDALETTIREHPCIACPYRRDVASGVWSKEDYDKLPPYDAETFAQPLHAFSCHATPDRICHGWAVVHTSRGHEFDLLALRLGSYDVPQAKIPLFASGTEAAEHGKRDMDKPTEENVTVRKRLLHKYPRLRLED